MSYKKQYCVCGYIYEWDYGPQLEKVVIQGQLPFDVLTVVLITSGKVGFSSTPKKLHACPICGTVKIEM